jgi:gliding motility-associated-like protein
MKSIFLLVVSFFFIQFSFGQEICDNGIDDDGDGFVDLNDDECECEGFGGIVESLIPNPSFEEMDCCPSNISQLDCASEWVQASSATSDYFNNCDFVEIISEGIPGADTDLPGGGDGWVGFWSMTGYKEYIGCCLDGPLVGGTEYTLNFYTAWAQGSPTLEISLFGSPTCVDLPWVGSGCPIGSGSWELLTSVSVTYAEAGPWQEVTVTFTPTTDMNAFAIGGPCGTVPMNTYAYVDNLTLIDSESFSDITETGSWCDGDLMLEASTDTTGGAWQWYLDGVAIIGETDATIDVMLYGLGEYTAVYTVGDNCLRSDHLAESDDGVSVSFDNTAACLGEPTDFTNTSAYDDVLDPDWEWDFGDGGTSTDENPSHTYTDAGTYTVELIGVIESGCNDTISIEVTVDPTPEANFEFVIDGFSSEDGSTGGCIASPVQFNDLSIIADPGIITVWDWDFGDGSGSDIENPEHVYGTPGTYTITLTVETENGCSSTFELDIIMTDGLTMDIIFNTPTCFGFSDGSVTVNVLGGAGDLTFEITDADDVLLNEDNSNTANTLGEGWYYINVTDGTACSGIDSIFLSQPGELDISITVIDPLCYGFETGTAEVTEVINYTGSDDMISYIWNPNPGENSGLGEDSTWAMGAGDYTLTINDENGCSKVFDFTVNEPEELVFTEFGFEHAYCRLHEYQSGNGAVFGAAAGGTSDYTYLWVNLDNADESINSTWGGLNPGNYELTATDAHGCTLVESLFLDSLNPIAAFTVNSAQLNTDCQGTATVEVEFVNASSNYANPNNPSADTSFFWNLDAPGAVWQLSHDFYETFDTTYGPKNQTYLVDVCLVAINKNGCTDTACKVLTIYKPIEFDDVNIFSPNGDGVNDEFTFEFKSASIAEFNCVIVNRWGIVVHEITNINDGWDGTDRNGDPCTNGVYFYKYVAKTDNFTDIVGQGTVQLVE